jgi:hypothetical protein
MRTIDDIRVEIHPHRRLGLGQLKVTYDLTAGER